MKIEPIGPISSIEPVKKVKNSNVEKDSTKSSTQEEAVVYEPSENQEPVTYKKTGHVYDKATVDKLKKQSEEAYSYLRELIEKLLLKQGHTLKTITNEEWANVEIDEETRLEAQAMIDPGGPYSPEAVSDRIVDFAKAISGGDITKLEKLKEAINEGFKQAEAILGELPEISRQTYDLIMEKLDKWAGKSDLEEETQSKE